MSDFTVLINESNESDEYMVLEIWHKDKKITAYIGRSEIEVFRVAARSQGIEESTDLYQSLKWLIQQ